MRVRLPENDNEVKIYFAHPTKKSGTTTKCVVMFGTVTTRDSEKVVVGEAVARRDSRDTPDRVVARTRSLEKALEVAEKAEKLSADQVQHIWNTVPMRIKYLGQYRKA